MSYTSSTPLILLLTGKLFLSGSPVAAVPDTFMALPPALKEFTLCITILHKVCYTLTKLIEIYLNMFYFYNTFLVSKVGGTFTSCDDIYATH